MQLFVYKRAAGLTGAAAFLVDRGVVGLKDAWVRMHLERSGFEEMLQASRRRGIRLGRTTPEEIRRWVAGGMRWALENGMRLPKDWQKPASFIGGVGDWQSADVSAFVKEFAGHPDDLRQRLVAEPFDSYILRDDVDFIFDTRAPYMDQVTGEYLEDDYEDQDDEDQDDEDLSEGLVEFPEEEFKEMTQKVAAAARTLADLTGSRVKARGDAPSPELAEGWSAMMVCTLLAADICQGAPSSLAAEVTTDLLQDVIERLEETRVAEYERGLDQVLDHLQEDKTLVQRALAEHGP